MSKPVATLPSPRHAWTVRDGVLRIAAITALSGFAGLGYEIVWARLLAASLGHEIFAVLGVITALFGGLALGSLLPGHHIATSRTPALWYAGLELAIGAWALVLIFLFPLAGEWMAALVPIDASPLRQWCVAFGLPFPLLLPATLAMGGTLPALEAVLAPCLRSGAAVGPVYAANTFGAVVGTLATTFWLVPACGLALTLALCAAINLVCAAAMWRVAGNVSRSDPSPRSAPGWHRDLAPLFLTGLLGIGYEVLAIRVVSQVLENTVFTFALLLAVYLLGTSCGAVMWTRWDRLRRAGPDLLVYATALACLAGAVSLVGCQTLLSVFRSLAPPSLAGRLAAESGVAVVVFLIPTIAMGALFSALAQTARDRAGSLGAAFAVNTFGSALAPIVFGPIAMPLLGPERGFVAIALLFLLVRPNRRRLALAAPLVGLFVVAPSVFSLRFVQTSPGSALVWHRDGVMAAVSVVRDRGGDNHLQVNNHFRMGGTVSLRSDHREAHIPLLLHPDPKRALFLGLGTGATLSAAGDHPGLLADGVELVPEVVESFPLFARAAPHIGNDPNLRIHVADARRFVRIAAHRYDVIVADLYHPSIDGSGALYAREHFAAIRARLADGGVFCQWLPLHQLDLATLRVIVRTFLAVFPDASAYLAQFSVETPLIALIGGGPQRYPAKWLDRRVDDAGLRARLGALDLKDDTSLFGLYLAGARELRGFAGDGPLNTDDRPVVAYAAPRATYVPADKPGARLVALLGSLHVQPQDVLGADVEPDSEASQRLADYWRARDRFLAIGTRTLAAGNPRNFIAEVAPQLVEVVRLSADFDAAYAPVLAMARQLGVSDPRAARRLLESLDKANPMRPEARRLLAALPPA
jgi:spermidine synthase